MRQTVQLLKKKLDETIIDLWAISAEELLVVKRLSLSLNLIAPWN